MVWHELPTIQQALSTAMSAIGALAICEPYCALGGGAFRLAKADRTPVCDAIVSAEFQTLHFDYGFPVLHREQQALYGFAALYCPPESGPIGAETRIVPLGALRNALRCPDPTEAADRIRDYTRSHGDGWLSPYPANTGRISMLLRFLVAACGQRRFASVIDSDSANFIGRISGASRSAISYLEKEHALLQEFGIDLAAAEDRVVLKPGDMLLIDNVTVAHGRIGRRQPRELWHMLFGLEAPSAAVIDRALQAACAACMG